VNEWRHAAATHNKAAKHANAQKDNANDTKHNNFQVEWLASTSGPGPRPSFTSPIVGSAPVTGT
jgi:hypothetical protein